MPELFRHLGYKIYFWSNENQPLEPLHVHISKGKLQENATKLWIFKSGDSYLVHNKSRIPDHEIRKIQKAIKKNVEDIVAIWQEHFGSISFYKENEEENENEK